MKSAACGSGRHVCSARVRSNPALFRFPFPSDQAVRDKCEEKSGSDLDGRHKDEPVYRGKIQISTQYVREEIRVENGRHDQKKTQYKDRGNPYSLGFEEIKQSTDDAWQQNETEDMIQGLFPLKKRHLFSFHIQCRTEAAFPLT